MTKVRRTAGAAVLPLVAAAVGIGVGATPADAAICSPLSSASITGPGGTPTAGSTVHVSARVSGMLLLAHLQITGPGLDEQIGRSAISGVIEGDVRVPKPGTFTLRVMGNGTGCVYDSDAFSVKERPSAPKPSPQRAAAGASGAPGATRASRIPEGIRDGGSKGLKMPRGGSPFRLPPVAPDGTGPSVHYPSADPQVAAPPIPQPQPRANNAAQTVPPIKWGKSIAIALVLLLLSAHMGMWSRRQRLAEAGGRRGRGARGARRANAGPRVTAQLPLANDHPAAPRDRDRPAEPIDGWNDRSAQAREPSSSFGSAGQDRWDDRPGQMREPSGSFGLAGQDRWGDRPGQVPGRSYLVGSAGESSAVDRESWAGTRHQMSAEDRISPRGWVDAADRDGSGGRDVRVHPGREMADQPYPFDRRDQPRRVGDGDPVHGAARAGAVGWTVAPPRVSGGSDPGAETSRVDSPGRDRAEVSVGRATRSGRGGYRGRRRRS